jgi:hypothetical protein
MNSYKDLTDKQIKNIISLSRYGLKIKVIADKVKASYSQVYQYYKVNNYSVKVDLNNMSRAEKAHFTRFINKKQVAVEHKVPVKKKVVIKDINTITNSTFFIPADKSYDISSNSQGTTITYY